jgi:hypothetical protein
MRPHPFVTALAVALFPAITAGAQASAQSGQSAAQSSPCHRCLDGFRFIPSSVVDQPFTNTSFENATGGGMALNLNVPVRNLAGDTLTTLNGNIGFFLLDFEYQKSVAKWLALRVGVNGIGRLGTSLEALVASGISAAMGGYIGATVPIWSKPNLLISAVADLKNNKQWDVDPYKFAKDVVDSGYTPDSKAVLLGSERVTRWSFGLRGAWAVKPWMGLTANIEPGGADGDVSGNKSLNTFGALAGFDLHKLWDVPISTSLGYRLRTGSGKSGNISGGYRSAQLGVYYNALSSVMIGGDLFYSTIRVQGGTIPDLNAVQFRLVTHIDF